MPARLRRLARGALCTAAILLLAGRALAGPAAGTSITNTATATYVDSASGINVRLTSNTVATIVQPLEALTLASSQTLSRTPGGSFAIPHVLTNTGNVTSTYAYTLAQSGGSYTAAGLALVEDVNGNGVADPGEPVLGPGATLTLAARGTLNLLVTGTVPAGTPSGASAQFRLTATTQLQAATAANTDTVNVAGGPVVSVAKSASVAAATPNASYSYTLSAQNSGTAPAGPVALTVNGSPVSFFVLRDLVPANTTFVAASSPTSGAHLLYHRLGDPAGAYVDAPPATPVDAVAYALNELDPGSTLIGVLTVSVHANASGTLANVAYADYLNLGAAATTASNQVRLALPALAPSIGFYTNGSYTTPAQQNALGAPLYAQVNAAQCNTDPTVVQSHPITLVSARTGDTETFNATETAPNSGVFRILPNVPTADGATHVVVSGDGILEVLPNDHVTATLTGCGTTAATAIVLIDPSGVVFDSKTNVPVAGTVVALVDVSGAGNGGHPGAAAKVYASDGVTPAPSTVTVGVSGGYTFPFVPASTYRFVVTPPNGYAFPSKLPPGLLPAGRNISATGSYGGAFVVSNGGGPVMIDVPLDTSGAGGLFLQKSASKSIVQTGDFVDYAITINNNTGLNFNASVLNDTLPAGFSYVKGSARLNNLALTDPVGGSGPALVFGIGGIVPGAPSTLTYRVHLGPDAANGTGVNTAQLVSGQTRSNPATARVQVTGGTLSDSAYLVGKVYADCNHNRIQDNDEPGIPGVRVYLDTGTYAVTDGEGKYSLYGLTPRTHVAKLDLTTLPRGVTLEVLGNRNALDAGSRYVDLKNGELAKADFAVSDCPASLRTEIDARRDAQKGRASEITRLATDKPRVGAAAISDARALPASGLIGVAATGAPGTPGAAGGAAYGLPALATPAVAAPAAAALSAPATPAPFVRAAGAAPPPAASVAAPTPAPAPAPAATAVAHAPVATSVAAAPGGAAASTPPRPPAFVNVRNGQKLLEPSIAVRVAASHGGLLRLTVNGRRIDAGMLEARAPGAGNAAAVWRYPHVALHPGANVLVAQMVDGRARASAPVSVTLHYQPTPLVMHARGDATTPEAPRPIGPPPRPLAPRAAAHASGAPAAPVVRAATVPAAMHGATATGPRGISDGAPAAPSDDRIAATRHRDSGAKPPEHPVAHRAPVATTATTAAVASVATVAQPAAPPLLLAAAAPAPDTGDAAAPVDEAGLAAEPVAAQPAGVPTATAPEAPAQTLGELLATLTPQAGFIDLTDGAILPADQARVRVKGPLDANLRLTVNGRTLDATQVGEQSRLESRGVSAWEYVGVNLKAGSNTLTLDAVDGFGNVRASAAVQVIAPGPLARIELKAPAQASADGATPVDVTVRLLDAAGVPVTARTAVTLEASLGEWQTPDLDPKEPGTQVFIEGGVAHYGLLAPANPGRARLKASTGALAALGEITFLPNLRPLLAAGILEGNVSLRSLSPGSLLAGQGTNVFERDLAATTQSFNDGKGSAAASASMYLKGAIVGDNLLTVSYDSEKPADTTLLRDIQPDRFYPVYGDSSVKGFDAQSTSKLYARVDHGTSYVLFGDYSTQSDNAARLLTQYNRVLNGGKTHIEDGGLTVDGFVSYTDTTQVIDEIPANGTSGPYHLSELTGLVNSQTVTLVTRDRNQPSIVLASQALTQFTDYAVEPELGLILFKAPVPSLDANLNPIYIRVTYEVDNGGPKYWVGGVDLRERIRPSLTLGGTYIRDANAADRQTLGGLNFLWQPSPATQLIGEYGQSQSDLTGTGDARRLEFKHSDATLQARVYAVQTDPTFNNPNSTYTAGASEYGAKIGYTIDPKDRLVVDALRTTTSGALIQTPSSIPLVGLPATIAGGASQNGENLALEHTLASSVKLTAGIRHVDANAVPTQPLAIGAVPNEFTSARVRLDVPVPDLPKAGAFAQYERALDDTGREAATFGGTYQLGATSKLYATHETSDSLSGSYGLSTTQQNYSTVVGIDTSYMKDGQLFNEYRVGDGVDGRSNEAAVGLRNLWHVAPGLGLSTSLQQIHPISGVVTNQATALAAALEYTANPLWKGSTRVEWSTSTTAQTWLSSAAAAAKIDGTNTLLVRGLYNEEINTAPGAGAIHLGQVQAGIATRPVGNDVWNTLALLEYKRAANSTLGADLDTDEKAYILSTNLNVQPSADWLLTGRYGFKHATDYTGGLTTTGNTQLVGARSVWDVTPHWDAGVQAYAQFAPTSLGGHQLAVGGEVGYLVMKNVWVSVGYNVAGFRDADLAGDDYTQKAFYLRLRFKFDENLFRPRNNADPLPASARPVP